jgi:hypothetical protein
LQDEEPIPPAPLPSREGGGVRRGRSISATKATEIGALLPSLEGRAGERFFILGIESAEGEMFFRGNL